MKDSAVQKNLKWSYFNLAAMAHCRQDGTRNRENGTLKWPKYNKSKRHLGDGKYTAHPMNKTSR